MNTSNPGAVKQDRKRCSSDERESGTLTLAGIGGTLQFIGGVADTTNVPPHSMKCPAGAPRKWCSIHDVRSPFSFSDSAIRYFGPWKSAKDEILIMQSVRKPLSNDLDPGAVTAYMHC